jgi:foldase protein PrsA
VNTFNREETDANKLEIAEERKNEAFGLEYNSFVAGLARDLNEELWENIAIIRDEGVTTADFFEVYEKYFK